MVECEPISKKRLLFDLYVAYFCAKRGKSKKSYVKYFEQNLHYNLIELRDEIYERRYIPSPSVCFIINRPKKREIFAAHFRDRIVHHLFYNYTYKLFDSTFIEDSYSCRIGKGTHYGIHRLERHIRQESENYTKDAYVLKLDISGYFMHINRNRLLEISEFVLDKMANHYVSNKDNGKKWKDILDFDLVKYLNRELILLDPTVNCVFKSQKSEWKNLAKSKSLFWSKPSQGLPIGNLTSQLLSNVYLNVLDQYIKRNLKCKHYGRYVDDFYIVSKDKEFLKSIIIPIKQLLNEKLDLDLHMGKTRILNVRNGVEFLGAYIKPNRTYVSNACLKRMTRRLYEVEHSMTNVDVEGSVNSILGIFEHYSSFNMKMKLLDKSMTFLLNHGKFNNKFTKYVNVSRRHLLTV